MPLIVLVLIQAFVLCAAQVMLKVAMGIMPDFTFSWSYVVAILANWKLCLSGVGFTIAGLLWAYILRHYPFSQAYPLASIVYVFGMIASILVFHEHVSISQWIGILLIMGGCYLVAG